MVALASAQFESVDAELESCQKDCCSKTGGVWENGTCNGPLEYGTCRNGCMESARDTVDMGYGNPCCAPSAILLAVAGFAIYRMR